jgi:hypothetical protein
MALTVYAFHADPHKLAVTKVDAPIEECPFLLDFSRPIQRVRWIGFHNRWIGPTVALGVPVVHQAEQRGEYKILVLRSEPYFVDLPKLWKEHRGSARSAITENAGGLDIIADWGRHFPDNH